MGFVVSTHGIGRLVGTAFTAGASDLRAAVIATGGTITDAAIEDAEFVNQVIGVAGETEVTNSGYTPGSGNRITLTGVTVTKNTTTNKLEIRATAPTVNNVGAGSVWRRILYYWHVGADATNVVLGVDTPAATLTPNGGNVTLPALTVDINDTSV
jgi:hypothetical protein